jgi:hypothetical protein
MNMQNPTMVDSCTLIWIWLDAFALRETVHKIRLFQFSKCEVGPGWKSGGSEVAAFGTFLPYLGFEPGTESTEHVRS